MRIVVISGPVGTGKSTLAGSLAMKFGAKHLRTTQDFMAAAVSPMGRELPTDRRGLQDLGDVLDAATGGRWVANGVAEWAADNDAKLVVVDAVRIKSQVDLLRTAFGSDVHHIHLHASRPTLSERYARRAAQGSHLVELTNYDEVADNATEAAVGELHADADTVIDTDRSSQADVLTRVAAALGLYGSRHRQLVDVLIGGQYGSEGKGNIAFYLAPDYQVLVRVGGPNAGHKVPLDTPYTHVLLPSGTMANQTAKIVLGPGSTLDVEHLLKEIADCQLEQDRLFIDPQAMVIEQADINSEQIHVKGIGSTGKGGGAAAARRITGRATAEGDTPVRLAKDVPELAPYIRRTSEVLDAAFERGERVLLEGTQGTALSLYHGHYPHVTSRDTTTAGCLAEAGIAPGRVRRVIMVCRTYPIRVKSPDEGTSGFMSQDLEWEVIAERSGVPIEELLDKEKGSRSGKQRRVAEFDWELLRRAAELNGATDIALTFSDYLDVNNREARRHDQLGEETLRFIEEVERVSQVPVSLIATRFHVRGIIDRRRW